jgi:hypothetical protein
MQRRGLFSLVLAGLVTASAAAQDVTLEWKLVKDKPFYQTMNTTTDQTMKVMGTDVTQKQDQTFYFSWTPTEDPKDGKLKLRQKIIGLKMNIDIGGSKINYDSTVKDNPAGTNNPLNKFFDALNNVEFTVTLDTKANKVTDISDPGEFVKKLSDQNPQMRPLLEKILSKQALIDMADPTFAALPGGKKKKGDTWDRSTTLDMGPIGKYETKYTYTFEGPVDPKKADGDQKISVKSTLTYTPPDEKVAAGLPFKIKAAQLEGKDSTGTVIYDPKAGMIKSSTLGLTLTGNLTIEIGQQSTAVDLTQKQATTNTYSDKDPTKK